MIDRCQSKISLVIDIFREMKRRGWNGAKLAEESHVDPMTITRLFKGSINIKIESINNILKTLDFLKESDNICDVRCGIDMREVCRKVKYIRDSKTDWWDSLEKNIDSFKKGVDIDLSTGLQSGTQKPATRTGSKKKAGSSG